MIRALEILTFTSSTNVLCLKIHIHMKRTILTANKDGRHSLPPHLSLNAHQQNEPYKTPYLSNICCNSNAVTLTVVLIVQTNIRIITWDRLYFSF